MRARKFGENNQHLEELIHVISHDLKEHLRTIVSYSDMLQSERGNRLCGKSDYRRKGIKKTAHQMQGILDDLSDLGRIGETDSWEPLDIPKLVKKITEGLVREGEEISLEVEKDFPRVSFDPLQMNILLENLIANALKYNSPPKKLKVGYKNNSKKRTTIYVKDNGRGIVKQYHKKIFKMFERLKPKEAIQGTGAGLGFCKHIVEANGGKIWVESTEGKGSTFYFTVPREYQMSERKWIGGIHSKRVAEMSRDVGRMLNLEEKRCIGFYIGGLLHDVGKVTIPERIHVKPDSLTEAEWKVMKTHPRRGLNELSKWGTFTSQVRDVVLHHHERLDGSGYPDGLKNGELSLEVRVVGLCDVVVAMSSRRPYRPARTRGEILAEFNRGKGSRYDPFVVDKVLEFFEK